jgi:copper resistance protein C
MKVRATRSSHMPVVLVVLVAGLLCAAAIAAQFIQAPAAAAHAKYTNSTPAANSTVTQAPSVVTVHFGEDVNPAGSGLVVYDTKGRVVSTAAGSVDTSNIKTISVPMTGDDAESYLVVWHTVSLDDGDPAVGAFIFNVGTPAQPGDSGGSTTSPGTSTTTNSTSGTPGWLVALVGIAGLIFGGAGTLVLAGRRR